MTIPAQIDSDLVSLVRYLLFTNSNGRGKYLAVKALQKEAGIGLRESKALTARIGDFTWSFAGPAPEAR